MNTFARTFSASHTRHTTLKFYGLIRQLDTNLSATCIHANNQLPVPIRISRGWYKTYATKTPKTTTRKKTAPKRTIDSNDGPILEQGLLIDPSIENIESLEILADIEEGHNDKSYPAVLHEALQNMRRLPNCVLLTRVGSFYELYFEHAEEYAHHLNLRLAKKKTSQGPVYMAGFPFMHLDRYLKILVQDLHKYVAISEEIPNTSLKAGQLREAALTKNLVTPEDYLDDEVRKSSKKLPNMFIRRVCRIITPGTLIDEKFLDPSENNYLLAVSVRSINASAQKTFDGASGFEPEKYQIGLAWLDFSTGVFYTQTSSGATITSDLARISPSEILLSRDLQNTEAQSLVKLIEEQQYFVTFAQYPSENQPFEVQVKTEDFEIKIAKRRKEFTETWKEMFELEDFEESDISLLSNDELDACSALLLYVQEKLPGTIIKLQAPVRRAINENMLIDVNSFRALEIKKTLREQITSGSLLNTVKRTVTKSGTRLLSDWLASPITSIPIIVQRQNLLQTFLDDKALHDDVVFRLKNNHDAHRVVQKLILGRGDAEDMISLLQSIQATSLLRDMFLDYIKNENHPSSVAQSSLKIILQRLQDLSKLEQLIAKTFDQEKVIRRLTADEQSQAEQIMALEGVASTGKVAKPKSQTRKGAPIETIDIMKRNASRTLSRLYSLVETAIEERDALESALKTNLKIASLDFRWAPGLGFYVHVGSKDIAKFEKENEYNTHIARCIIARRSTRSYHYDQWTVLGSQIDSYKMMIRVEERKLFQTLRQKVIVHMSPIRRNARVMDELDVACSFASLARERDFVRPVLHEGTALNVVSGRHTTVEHGLEHKGVTFVANDCYLGAGERLWLITGPNMGGKSTFLRQNALLIILAQVGSYVPASFAEIGIVDQIFSRVGSADNLYRDESTFMVEMLETANILKHATSKSFVIMDEIGRGTTPLEGLAIAYGCLKHLYDINKSLTLFATHFHDLADMIENLNHAACYCTELGGDEHTGLYFKHSLRRGVNRRSHGLHIAKMAGVPSSALEIAENALSQLEGLHLQGGTEVTRPTQEKLEWNDEVAHEHVTSLDISKAL
ncbi:muts domain V-domain-containing protein [Lipomyces japonicus]|uniref:muts domain V-domain-containing protein n=1 Tax=Lipomyces japonicus TaxID=56871 RepID=UPI0034CEB89D